MYIFTDWCVWQRARAQTEARFRIKLCNATKKCFRSKLGSQKNVFPSSTETSDTVQIPCKKVSGFLAIRVAWTEARWARIDLSWRRWMMHRVSATEELSRAACRILREKMYRFIILSCTHVFHFIEQCLYVWYIATALHINSRNLASCWPTLATNFCPQFKGWLMISRWKRRSVLNRNDRKHNVL